MSQASAILSALRQSREDGNFVPVSDPSFFKTRDAILDALAAEPEPRELRELKFKLKSAYKEVGKAASRIYDLRARLAESQSINKVDPTGYRGLLADNREQAAEITKLKQKVHDLEHPEDQ